MKQGRHMFLACVLVCHTGESREPASLDSSGVITSPRMKVTGTIVPTEYNR